MRIHDGIKKAGYFWLPAHPELRLPGTLNITDGGEIELEVVGTFDGDIKDSFETFNIERIVGEVEGNDYVTLDKCFYRNKNPPLFGLTKSTLYVHKAIFGVQCSEGEELTFNEIRFSVEGLDAWLATSGIKIQNDFELKTTQINFALPPDKIYKLSDGSELKISFSGNFPGSGTRNTTEVRVRQSALLRIISKEPRAFDYFTSLAFNFCNFLCFAVDSSVNICNVYLLSDEVFHTLSDGRKDVLKLKAIYPSRPFNSKVPEIAWHKMLFQFPAIESSAENVFNNWIRIYSTISPALNLYFSAKSGEHRYLEGRFLALAQALEVYHRRTSSETSWDVPTFEAKILSVLIGCPAELMEWVTGRLQHANEIPLAKRLTRIVEKYSTFIAEKNDRKKLVRRIVDIRNYLTHYDKETEGKISLDDLWILCRRMEAIFQLTLLSEIEFTPDQISSIVENSQSLKYKFSNAE